MLAAHDFASWRCGFVASSFEFNCIVYLFNNQCKLNIKRNIYHAVL